MKRYSFLIFILFASCSVIAQNAVRTETGADTTEKPKISVNLASIYASDASYYGQASIDRLPYVLANASVNFPTGFFVSAGAYKLLNYGSGVSGVDLSAGYDIKLLKNLSGSVSFSHSFFPDSSLFLQSTNTNMASASLSYDFNLLKTGISADYALGDQSALYTTFSASKSFDLGSLFSDKDYISFDPNFELVGGTQRIVTTEQVPGSTPPAKNGNGNGLGLLRLPVTNKASGPQYREVEKASFDLLSYNLKLPIAYNRANYAVEATYQGSVLSKKVSGASQQPRSFFYLGVYYMF